MARPRAHRAVRWTASHRAVRWTAWLAVAAVAGYFALPLVGVYNRAQVYASARQAAQILRQGVDQARPARPTRSKVAAAVVASKRGAGLRVRFAWTFGNASDHYEITNRWRRHPVCLTTTSDSSGNQAFEPGGAQYVTVAVSNRGCGPAQPW